MTLASTLWIESRPGCITMHAIADIRRWAEGLLEARASTLKIERDGPQTRVTLRFVLADGIGVADVAALMALKRQRLRREVNQARLREVCRYEAL
jgi:hypothetical protein